ncbi:MAG: 4-(cytidine 5'-diphospho)-2-C-methyl-D-erythritol kinase [Oscillospiraceae bacterium]|jgi:4-diphosphocytidyl-2-C-methyl-D-erythritol kinase|nr:4-(cytidine 5'-diphospho)-2-C-methyl-D-erythritol kinase [Oscillospiraceae bacterium]
MANSLTLEASAKINIFLDILGLLSDGCHSLFMLMQTISISDTITLHAIESGISLTCSNPALPTGRRNIAYRAAELFLAEADIVDGVAIHIEKRIPFEAGLGGGSADAAAVLRGLSQLYGGLSKEKLAELALQLGADVPYCLMGGTAIAMNRGEVLAPLPPLPQRHCVIIKPACGVSTAAAYKAYDTLEVRRHLDIVTLTAAAANADWEQMCTCAANVLEQCVEVPNRAQYKAIMRKYGAELAQMTGSGSAVFGIFSNEEQAQKTAATLKKMDAAAEVFVCTT